MPNANTRKHDRKLVSWNQHRIRETIPPQMAISPCVLVFGLGRLCYMQCASLPKRCSVPLSPMTSQHVLTRTV
eukprot:486189-Rhodomonas_salina.2